MVARAQVHNEPKLAISPHFCFVVASQGDYSGGPPLATHLPTSLPLQMLGKMRTIPRGRWVWCGVAVGLIFLIASLKRVSLSASTDRGGVARRARGGCRAQQRAPRSRITACGVPTAPYHSGQRIIPVGYEPNIYSYRPVTLRGAPGAATLRGECPVRSYNVWSALKMKCGRFV